MTGACPVMVELFGACFNRIGIPLLLSESGAHHITMHEPLELILPEDADTLADVATVFASQLGSSQQLIVEVPLPSVGSTNSYLDLIQDFAEASLICERLGACAEHRALRWGKSGHVHVIFLELQGYLREVLVIELAWMAILLDWSNCEAESLRDAYYEIREASLGHEECLHQARLIFPELADHYLGNLVMGAYYEWEDMELLKAELLLHPERKYGFFISRSVSPEGRPVLSSNGQLIVPEETSLEKVLAAVGYEGETLLPAEVVMTDIDANFSARHVVVGVRAEDVFKAIACGDDFMRRVMTDSDSHEILGFQGRSRRYGDEPCAFVGELSGCAILRCTGFTILFLDAEPLANWQRAAQANRLSTLEVSLRDGGSPSPGIDLAWEMLDDELFEQLCYDYLYAQPFFDRNRLEKIGKSRSRDGGRDIVAWTSPVPPMFHPPVKYIFQCKYIQSHASLTTKHFRSVSDVIEQYGASGYGVMCSGYIDATLHDRIDAISERRGVGSWKIDRFQLERFLFRRPHIVERYFRCSDE